LQTVLFFQIRRTVGWRRTVLDQARLTPTTEEMVAVLVALQPLQAVAALEVLMVMGQLAPMLFPMT
jgi:hypothetical protein